VISFSASSISYNGIWRLTRRDASELRNASDFMSTATMTVLRLDRVCKTYGEGESTVEAVRDVSLDLEAGKFIFLMGPSGSGKTTLLMLMGCLLRPTTGSVHLFDEEVSSLSEGRLPRIRRSRIGYI